MGGNQLYIHLVPRPGGKGAPAVVGFEQGYRDLPHRSMPSAVVNRVGRPHRVEDQAFIASSTSPIMPVSSWRTASSACPAACPGRGACRRRTTTSSRCPPDRTSTGPCAPTPEPTGNMLLGGSRKAMEMIRWPSASRLPVRRKNGTPAQRQLSIEHFTDEGFGIGLRVDAFLGPISRVLPADDVLRVDRQHAAEDLILFLTDGRRLQGCRRFHRHESEDLEQVGAPPPCRDTLRSPR